MKLNYGISDRPPFPRLISLALQQMMAILTATTALPMLVGHGVSPAAAMFGAGAGTFLYLLLKDPGMERTLLGDGLGSIVGAFFGGCPNTTYGEAIACVALTGNASTITTLAASLGCIGFALFTPFMAFISSMPSCVMGGICVAAYGFITASGLRMIQNIDLNENRNIFVISVILITGAGQLSLNFGAVTITEVASALVLGILTNLIVSRSR